MADPMQAIATADNFAGADGVVEKLNENFDARHGFDVRTVTTTATQLATDEVILGDTTAGGFTITLLPLASWANRSLVILKLVAANTLTIDGSGAETVNNSATVALTARYSYRRIFNTGTELVVIGNE